ncbi:hypothetical protein PIB30_006139 [Stylosanthes scabra]|uniref:Uncharacterized protein n=1 Tax=Stylosanthes scabra TaxID=79078 RepID=A0ABU6X2B5_9FABA|nr:hypothetical protein [Stylosanthes scabra]
MMKMSWMKGNFIVDRNATIVVHRPPPKPPDLKSLAVGEGEPTLSVVTTEAGLCWIEDFMDDVTRIHNGAEDGAVAKENVDAKAEPFSHFLEDDDVAKVNRGGLAEVGMATDLSGGCFAEVVDDGTRSSAEVGASCGHPPRQRAEQ